MSYQVLARKWRPLTFGALVGQEHVQRALSNALTSGRLHHAYLFTGTRGVGKTTISRILSKSLNCEQGLSAAPCCECRACKEIDEGKFVDLLEIDAASRTKVEDTREILDNVQYRPTRGRYKVYLIDEVHMLSNSSFNALLKTLEEPPPHVVFLLATTDPQKIPPTVLSRCLQFHLKSLSPEQVGEQLTQVVRAEGFNYEDGAIKKLALAADGSMRDGLSLLDQAIAYSGGELNLANINAMLGTVDFHHISDLLSALLNDDAESLLQTLQSIKSVAPDLPLILTEFISFLHAIAVFQVSNYIDPQHPNYQAIKSFAPLISPQDVQLYYQLALHGRRDLPLAPHAFEGLEMTFLRMLAFRPADGGAQSVSKQPVSKKVELTEKQSKPEEEVSLAPNTLEQPSVKPEQVSPVTQQDVRTSMPPMQKRGKENADALESGREQGIAALKQSLKKTPLEAERQPPAPNPQPEQNKTSAEKDISAVAARFFGESPLEESSPALAFDSSVGQATPKSEHTERVQPRRESKQAQPERVKAATSAEIKSQDGIVAHEEVSAFALEMTTEDEKDALAEAAKLSPEPTHPKEPLLSETSAPEIVHAPEESQERAPVKNDLSWQHLDNSAWIDLVERAALSGVLAQIALNSALVAVNPKGLVLGVQSTSRALCNKDRLLKLKQALVPLLPGDWAIEVQDSSDEQETPAERAEKRAKERFDSALESLRSDKNLQMLQMHFDVELDADNIVVLGED